MRVWITKKYWFWDYVNRWRIDELMKLTENIAQSGHEMYNLGSRPMKKFNERHRMVISRPIGLAVHHFGNDLNGEGTRLNDIAGNFR